MREYTPDPRVYEMMTILSPDVSEDDLPAHIETIAGYITTAGGTVNETLRESPWGRRRLAYSIRHTGRDIRDGFYTVFHFTLDPSGVRDIERDLKLNDQVMRFLITHFTPRPDVPGASATPDGAETAEAVVEAEVSPVEDSADSTVPADAAAASETISEAVETPSIEVADVTEASEVSVAPEAPEAPEASEATVAAVETGAAEAPATEAPVEDVEAESAPVDEVVAAVESVESEVADVEEAPIAEVASADEETTEETPAEPTAPAKDDEEA